MVQEKAAGPLREALTIPEKMKRYEPCEQSNPKSWMLGEEMADRVQ
jgi:hypothetical protein